MTYDCHEFSKYAFCRHCGTSELEQAENSTPCDPPSGVDVSLRERRARAMFEPIIERVIDAIETENLR